MNFKDTANLALLEVLGIGQVKNVAAVDIQMRPQQLPLVTVQYVYLGEYGSNHEPGAETKKFNLVEVTP